MASHTHAQTQTGAHTYVHTSHSEIYTHFDTHMQTQKHTCTHTHHTTHTSTSTHTHTHTHTITQINTHISTPVSTPVHPPPSPPLCVWALSDQPGGGGLAPGQGQSKSSSEASPVSGASDRFSQRGSGPWGPRGPFDMEKGTTGPTLHAGPHRPSPVKPLITAARCGPSQAGVKT